MAANNTSSELTKKAITNSVVILPFIFTVFFVYKYGITIPYWDQWELVPLIEKMYNHTLTLADIWTQHNEHRILFPQLIMLFLVRLSNWNIALELCTNVVLGCCILLCLLSLLKNTLKTVPLWLKFFTSLMAFSIIQYQNWLWGWQLQIFMSVLGSVVAIWAADKWQGKTIGLIIVIMAAIVSSYSFNSGLITWPVVLFVFLLREKWKLKHIAILVLACIATTSLYYYKYTKPEIHPPLLFFIRHPLIYTKYVLAYLGSSLSWDPSVCFKVTTVLLIIISSAIFNLWRYNRQKLRDLSPWLALALYVCMAACATGLGRCGFGWQQAFASRYTTISFLFPLSAVVLFWYSIKFNPKINNKQVKNPLFIVMTVLFIVSYVKCFNSSKEASEMFSSQTNFAAFCLDTPQIAPDYAFKRLYPLPDVIKSRIKTLSELGIKFKK